MAGPGLPYMVSTDTTVHVQTMSFTVCSKLHRHVLLTLCLGKPATSGTFCLAKSEALHFSKEAP